MKSEKWYQSRLAKYVDKHYKEYDDSIAWHNNPAPNQWMFDIPELGQHIELTCDDNGVITNKTKGRVL